MNIVFNFICIVTFSSMTLGCFTKMQPELVTHMNIKVNGGDDRLCANQTAIPIGAVVTYKNGEVLETWTEDLGSRMGKLSIEEFQWSSNLAMIDSKGWLYLPKNRLSWLEQDVTVKASIPSRPEMVAEKSIPPDYSCHATFDYSGQPGYASSYFSRNGQNGPHLMVSMGYLKSRFDRRLVLLKIETAQKCCADYYVIEPSDQALVVVADGGKGADGADGSDGSNGSDGRSGTCFWSDDDSDNGENADHGTNATDGDNGGNGGNGGQIEIHYDQTHPELVGLLHYSVHGGARGAGGQGGTGGKGGQGGSGCNGGQDGSDGQNGLDGRDGDDGFFGNTGRVVVVPRDVSNLFSREISQGAPIMTKKLQP